MIKIVLTKEAKDKKVIDPETLKRVSKNGLIIPKITSYWKNRKKDGDVEIVLSGKDKPQKTDKGEK